MLDYRSPSTLSPESMSLCINPHCDNPENSDTTQFCQSCGSALLLKQRYRATKVLGGGGFGKTYEASDLGTPNKVIKVLINNSPKAVELFQREAEVLSQLKDQGIPRVEPNSYIVFHPANNEEPVHCLVMEKIHGDNLRDYLKKLRQTIDSDTAARWLRELVLILQQVHEQGILHRDIKPQNIIFKPDGRLALIDFGAVREGSGTEVATAAGQGGTEVASHMARGTTISSVGYTSPEQINGHAMRQSDFYSLGRTFMFLLTGKEPSEIAYDAYTDVLRWREYAPNVETKFADLLDQMQSTQVKQRPENAGEILQILEGLQAQSLPKTTSKKGVKAGSRKAQAESHLSAAQLSKPLFFYIPI
jgi:eukaryotic-like serine/threonine-protein kinase